mmetsp:Transcript_16698/g.51893  ORF Transcript_16698/g.51893 Transcript_16698/m.51893 type:complete len:288 (+) Transcript_16698:860-1723(+)
MSVAVVALSVLVHTRLGEHPLRGAQRPAWRSRHRCSAGRSTPCCAVGPQTRRPHCLKGLHRVRAIARLGQRADQAGVRLHGIPIAKAIGFERLAQRRPGTSYVACLAKRLDKAARDRPVAAQAVHCAHGAHQRHRASSVGWRCARTRVHTRREHSRVQLRPPANRAQLVNCRLAAVGGGDRLDQQRQRGWVVPLHPHQPRARCVRVAGIQPRARCRGVCCSARHTVALELLEQPLHRAHIPRGTVGSHDARRRRKVGLAAALAQACQCRLGVRGPVGGTHGVHQPPH